MSLAFGIGTIVDFFHILGSLQFEIDRLKSLVTDGVILAAVNFNILADTPSGPLDLVVSRNDRRSKTSSSVQRLSSRHSVVWAREEAIGGCEVMKQE